MVVPNDAIVHITRRSNAMAEISSWDAFDPKVWAEEVGSPPRPLSLRHPTYPAEDTCPADDLVALRKIVAKYLRKVRKRLDLPDLFAADDEFKVFMGWLDLPADDGSIDPRKSVWVSRYKDPTSRTGLIDRSIVFAAAESWQVNDSAGVLGSRAGTAGRHARVRSGQQHMESADHERRLLDRPARGSAVARERSSWKPRTSIRLCSTPPPSSPSRGGRGRHRRGP